MKTSITFLSLLFSIVFAQNWDIVRMTPMPEAVTNNAVCEGFANDSSYILSFGGLDTTKTYTGIHLKSWRYNVEQDAWMSIPDLPDTLGKIASGATHWQGVVFIMGGYHVFSNGNERSSDKVHRYDIASNAYLPDGVPIPVATDDHVQAIWRDSLIYVISGWNNTRNIPNVQVYNPEQDTWIAGTPVPNNNLYKSFGASGTIIGDTIYYFGGASMGFNFPIQNNLRKGVIDPNNPSQIQWSQRVVNTGTNGYRMASTSVGNTLHWLGGSGLTYNYDGIAYNGSGGVSPLNRDLSILANDTAQWKSSSNYSIPMDLRGIANMSDTIKFISGGMSANQTVSDELIRLAWRGPISNIDNKLETLVFNIFYNLSSNTLSLRSHDMRLSRKITLSILDVQGRVVFSKKAPDINYPIYLPKLKPGLYIVKAHSTMVSQAKKIVIH